MTSGENLIPIGYNGVKLQVIKEIQISHHMTRYGQTLGVFKDVRAQNFPHTDFVKTLTAGRE